MNIACVKIIHLTSCSLHAFFHFFFFFFFIYVLQTFDILDMSPTVQNIEFHQYDLKANVTCF